MAESSSLTVKLDSTVCNDQSGAFSKIKKNFSRQSKNGRYPFDFKYHYGAYDLPEYEEHGHIRESNNLAVQSLSKALAFASKYWTEDDSNYMESPSDQSSGLVHLSPSSSQRRIQTSPIKRRLKGRRKIHKVNLNTSI